MDLNEYQTIARSTAIYPVNSRVGLIYVSLKLNGEAGEIAEGVGKAIRDDAFMSTGMLEMPRTHALAKELGDVLWYVSAMAAELGYTLEEIAHMNLAKLGGRKSRGTLSGSGDDR